MSSLKRLLEYDSKGFIIPINEFCLDLDDFVRFNEMRDEARNEIFLDPHALFLREYNLDLDITTVKVKEPYFSIFKNKYETEPSLALLTDESGMVNLEAVLKNMEFIPFLAYRAVTMPVGIIYLEGSDDLNLPLAIVPIINNRHVYRVIDRVILHESTHAIRRQLNQKFVESLEEYLANSAYSFKNHFPSISKLILDEAILKYSTLPKPNFGSTFKTLIYPLELLESMFPFSYTILSPDKQVHKKIRRLVEKGESENINMNYVLLRSNPSEFNLKEPLKKQIESKEGIRWRVIKEKTL